MRNLLSFNDPLPPFEPRQAIINRAPQRVLTRREQILVQRVADEKERAAREADARRKRELDYLATLPLKEEEKTDTPQKSTDYDDWVMWDSKPDSVSPVPAGTKIRFRNRRGQERDINEASAGTFFWQLGVASNRNPNPNDVVAYKVLGRVGLDEGWVRWDPKPDSVCPVPAGTKLRGRMRDGAGFEILAGEASAHVWRKADPPIYDTVAYKVLEEAKPTRPPSFETVRDLLIRMLNDSKNRTSMKDLVKAKLAGFGAHKLAELDPAHFAALHLWCTQWLNRT